MKETLEIEGYFLHFDRSDPLDEIKKKLTHLYHWARHQGELEEKAKHDQL